MDPNYIGIRRVYTREVGQLVADQTLNNAAPLPGNEIVVEWEAGAAANRDLGTAGALTLEIMTRNVTTNAIVSAPLTQVFPGGVNTDGESHNGTYERPINIGPGNLQQGQTYETVARLYRPNNTVSFATWMFHVY